MSGMVANLAIILGAMQLSKKIDWEDKQVLTNMRLVYLASNVIVFALFAYIYAQIQKKKGCHVCLLAWLISDQTALKYVDAVKPLSQESPLLITTTVQEYDTSQVKSAVTSALMGIGMMGLMHLYFGYTQPLLVQSIMPIKNLFESKVARIHLLGSEPVGDLKRPWKTGGLFAGAADVFLPFKRWS
jgi:hypothetical protein